MYITGIQSSVVNEDSIFCVDGATGYLFEIDLNTWDIKNVIVLDDLYYDKFKVSYLYMYNGSIWIVPLHMAKLGKYDITSKSVSIMSIDKFEETESFSYVYMHENSLYFFPDKTFKNVRVFSLEREELIEDKIWSKYFGKHSDMVLKMFTSSNEHLFFCLRSETKIIGYSFEENNFWEKQLSEINEIQGVACSDGELCVSGTEPEEVFKIDINTKEIRNVTINDECGSTKRPVYAGGNVILSDSKNIFLLTKETIRKIPIENLKNDTQNAGHYLFAYMWRDKYILPPCHANKFCILDASGKYVDGKQVDIPNEIVKKYIEQSEMGMVTEKILFTVKDFIDSI